MESECKTSELLKKKINLYGELHLDRELTALILKLIEADERFAAGMEQNIKELHEILKPLIERGGRP